MGTTFKEEKPGNLIAVGVPTKSGYFSTNFWISTLQYQTPINVSTVYIPVIGKPVDEARNIIVEQAKRMGARYLFFVDDDVLVPNFAIPRLLNLGVKVASGVYYTKYQPPTPVVLNKGVPGGYTDWVQGDVIDVDYIGMGCCLIDMSVFDEMEPPYFKYLKGASDPSDKRGTIGEDVWFCKKVAEAGHKVWVDTGIQCVHEDFANRMQYMHHETLRCGVWRDGSGKVMYLPTAEQSKDVQPDENAVAGLKVCWGYDADPEWVEAGTVTPAEFRMKWKDMAAVKVRNMLEYRSQPEVVGILNELHRLMADGAPLQIEVPDAATAARRLTDESSVDDIEKAFGSMQGRYQSVFTRKYLEDVAGLVGFKDINVETCGEKLVFSATK